jgi:hypothetical protein
MGDDLLSDVTRGWVAGLIDLFGRWRTRSRQKRELRKALCDPAWEWRTFEALQRAIREDAETTRALLFEIGARPSEKRKDVWTLK